MSKMKHMYKAAQKYLVGGTTAGGRFHATLGQPLFLERAKGSRLYDADGNEYIDFHTSAGAAIFGYDHPRIIEAVRKSLEKGFFLNFETEYHYELAKLISEIIPCAEMIRISNTGTEATMAAVRLARGYTKKEILIRFEGHFHGMNELVWYNHNNEGKMDETGEIANIADTGGIPRSFSDVVKNVEFNDIDALEKVVNRYKGQVAAIMMEPISYNCGCYPARKEYLHKVRELCDREGIVLIFDEVISGFRVRPGSAQAFYGVTPDLTTLGKALGGGVHIAALVGKKEIMQTLNPLGPVVMSGTYTSALMPILVAIECLKMVKEPYYFDHLDKLGDVFYGGFNDLMKKHGLPGHLRGIGARFGIYFGVENPDDDYNWRKVKEHFDSDFNRKFLKSTLQKGLYFHDYGTSPVPAHNGFGLQHTVSDMHMALERIDQVFSEIK